MATVFDYMVEKQTLNTLNMNAYDIKLFLKYFTEKNVTKSNPLYWPNIKYLIRLLQNQNTTTSWRPGDANADLKSTIDEYYGLHEVTRSNLAHNRKIPVQYQNNRLKQDCDELTDDFAEERMTALKPDPRYKDYLKADRPFGPR